MSGSEFADSRLAAEVERRFRLLAEAMPQVVWTARRDGHRDFSNRRWSEATGLPAAASLGTGWMEAVHPGDREAQRREFAAAAGERRGFEFEYRLRMRDGTFRRFLSRAEPILDGEGDVVRWCGACTDIDDRKSDIARGLAEDEVRASERLFRATFENAAVGIAHVAPDGKWLRVNDTLCAILGYSRQELVPLTFSDITHPDDIEADWSQARALLAGEADTYTMQKRYVRKDGRIMWVNLTVSLIRTPAGEPDFFISVVEDISARRQAEDEVGRLNAELRARLHELQTILDTAPVGINVSRDPGCKVIRGNQALAEMLGMPVGENVSKSRDDADALPYRILKDGEEAPPESLPMQRAAATGRPVGDDLYEIARDDGSRIQALVRANPVNDESGAVTGAVGICVDVTALKRAEQALRDADRRKDDFLATLAHELRNPLAAITMAHALARNERTPPESMRWAIDIIDRQLRQLGRLIDDLADVSRIARGKVRLSLEPVDLGVIVTRVVESMSGPIADRGHELRLAVSTDPMPLHVDPARIEQVLINLMNNAVKYTDPGGRLELTAAPEGNEVVLRVRDNGVGIPRAMLAKVFDLFSQVDDSVGRSQGGLGIGLTLVRSLIEMHGGRVSVMSDGPGRGAEFTVRLPLLVRDPGAGSVDPTPSPESTAVASRARRILLVDDNIDAATSLALLLSCHGHFTRSVHDGPAAIEAGMEFQPEIVILDIGLPGMNGYEVATALRRDLGEGTLLIALTGYAQERDRQRSREAGFDDHLPKPVDPEHLLSLIEDQGIPG